MGFIFWHYTAGVRKLVEIWRDIFLFLGKYFSIGRHFQTLFSSWKRDISKVARPGFHPLLWLQSAVENAVTRLLGAIVRSAVISVGVFVEISFLFFGIFLLAVWFGLPVFLLTIFFAIYGFSSGDFPAASFWAAISLFALLVLLFSRKLFSDRQKNYVKMELKELSRQKWFSRVWKRIGNVPSRSVLENISEPALFGRFLEACHISEKEFFQIVDWETAGQIERENKSRFWLKENLDKIGPIGRNWTYAYTANLDRYSTDLSRGDFSEYKDSKLVGHDQERNMLELVLMRPSQNNVLIIAEAGVGRHTLIHSLAEKVRTGKVNPVLKGKRILELNLNELISSSSSFETLDAVLREMFFEAAYAGNIILVVNDLDHYIRSNPQTPKEDISTVLLEFLNYPTFQIIGLTTPRKFHEDLEKNEGVMKFFEKIHLGEATADDALEVLLYKLKDAEKDRIIFTYPSLKEIIKLSERYFSDSPFPEKALDLMEEVLLWWSKNSYEEYVTPEVVDQVVSQKVRVPIGEMTVTEKDKLVHLEEILHARVIGQNFAVRQIAETMRRARVGLASSKKPIGSFLFLGPTGVGKTESAKALAEAYFGDENRMIRLDMSEYQKADSIDRLLGSAESGKTGVLSNKVKENPYSLLLLDEIEKAHSDILNLFLQILDEGWLTDVFGKKINFKNQIIIATSNAGAKIIKENIEQGKNPEEIQKTVTDFVIREGIFRPELLNCFEGVIFFHPLSESDILAVTEKLLQNYAQRLKTEKDINIQFGPDVVEEVARKSFDPVFGARAVHRYIEDKIGDNIVKKIISEEIREGDSVMFGVSGLV